MIYIAFIISKVYFCRKSHCIVNTKEIGIIIKERRQSLKVKQLELSELAGVGNPKLKTLLSILDTLGLQVNIKLKD